MKAIFEKLKFVLWYIKCSFGHATVYSDDVCLFSDTFFDVHDYKINKGGDGIPSYFYTYKCWKCGKEFTI